MTDSQTTITGWIILDQMGHVTLAGYATTVILGGTALLRLDVPETSDQPAFTTMIGLGSIYRLTFVTEEIARAAVRQLRPEAVTVYIPRQLTAGVSYETHSSEDEEYDDEEGDDDGTF